MDGEDGFMSVFEITGGNPLMGEITVHGAKNSVLPILSATILSPGVSVIHNCPQLSDVSAAIEILRHLGCGVMREGDTVTVDATVVTCNHVPDHLMGEMRSSVIFLGAVLGRTGGAVMSLPGGCELGPRPIDLHLAALRSLGAEITEGSWGIRCSGGLQGCEIALSIPSVGATENAMLAAVSAQGITTITNAAREPEIVDLQQFLQAIGAKIQGAGTSTITIQGGEPLHDGEHTVIGDRIVAATYLSAVASAGGEVAVGGVDYRHLSTVSALLMEGGCSLRSTPGEMVIKATPPLNGVRPVRTACYPGFPTDAQAPVMAAFARSRGATVFVENIFSSRYRHVDELRRMGADIRVEDRVAVVYGVDALHGATARAHDLRGGAALVVAALGAQGESQIQGLQYIDRGYQDLDQNLRNLGAEIVRV